MAAARSRRPSLVSMWPKWALTVTSLTYSSRAISLLAKPLATSLSTSSSRGVREVSGGRRAGLALARNAASTPVGGGKVEVGPATGHRFDCFEEFRAGGVLELEAACP